MASAAVLGAMKIILGGDTSDLDKALKGSESKLTSFGSALKIGMAAVAASVTAAGAALALSIKSTIDSADQINSMAQSTGQSVEELSKLKYAADLSEVSMETLGKSIVNLSKNMVAAASDGAGPAGAAFTAMGVSIKNQDGTLRSSSVVLQDIAQKFASYSDGAAKTNLAVQLFGKTGADMIPLLNKGRDGLQEAGDEAEKFGIVLDSKTTAAASEFNENLKKMDAIKQGLVVTITAKLLPAFDQISAALVQFSGNTSAVNTVSNLVSDSFKFLAVQVLDLTTRFERAGAEVSAFFEFLNTKVYSIGDLQTAWGKFTAEQEKSEQVFANLKTAIANIYADIPNDPWKGQASDIREMNDSVLALSKSWGLTQAPIVAAAAATQNAVDMFLGSQAKRTAGMIADAQTTGLSVAAHEQMKVKLEAEAIAINKNIPLTDALKQRIAATGLAAANAALQVAGANEKIAAMTPAQQFAQTMNQLRQEYDAGAISLETYNARQQQVAQQASATWDQASASIAGSFATISGAFGQSSSSMATAAKVFGAIQATISMFTGAAKALELPFPANLAAMAAVLAQGATLVASIKSQSVPTGMMTGGSMMVQGGGGADSVPVSFMASPGERIDVWRPDQGGGADPRKSGGGKVVNLYMPTVTTRDAIRSIIGGINEAIADGARLNIKPA